ncbi:unnamed protein product [Microthlaspi erraticum]|uniref:Uncharacterized protein n=1 Tax=Microthlaspi erraticum TaxID=1685480 RepID=A0A6D2JA20_9BRAS|nr:unnamed protein product [Microthlaspi erraticum]
MNVSQAFKETSRNWYLYADAFKVEKEIKSSNPELAERNKDIGTDSALVDVHDKDLSVEEGLETQVAEKTTGKRKWKRSDGEKCGEKRVNDLNRSYDSNEVEAVVAPPKSESCAVLPTEENVKGEKSVLDSDKLVNHLEKKRKSSKDSGEEDSLVANKRKRSVGKEDSLVASGAENLKKIKKNSTKKYKKKHSEKTVESQDYVPGQILEEKAEIGDNFCPSQNEDIAGFDKKQNQVMKLLDLHHGGSVEGSLNTMKPKEKNAIAQPASSVTSHFQSVVKNDHSGFKVDLSDAYVKGTTVDNKNEALKKIYNGSIFRKPKARKTKLKSSDDDSDVVTSILRKQGTNLAGGTDRSLQGYLRSSKPYKEAKLRDDQAENKYVDDECLGNLYVPDSLSN